MPGKYFDELNVGDKIKHGLGRTITEADNVLFCALTMNTQPLHINEDFASRLNLVGASSTASSQWDSPSASPSDEPKAQSSPTWATKM